MAFLVTGGLATAIFVGCGGGGSSATGTSGTQLSGNAAVRAAALANYQSVGAGIGFPVQALKISAPSGSKVPLGVGNSLRSILSVAQAMGKTSRTPQGTLTYIPEFNLYAGDATQSGDNFTIPFYSDSAGTTAAGTASLNIPGGNTNYVNYPETITMTANITGGNIPLTGNGQIKFTSPSGSNTMTGTITQTKNNVVLTLNLALDSSFNVTGSVNVQESNATISVTNVSGSVANDLTCNIAVSPTGLSGTGTLNLITGVITVNIPTTGGTSKATIDSNGNLVLSYADGTGETVPNPESASLTSGNGTTNTTTGSSTSTGTTTATGTATGTTTGIVRYQAPIAIALASGEPGPGALSKKGDMVISTATGATYWSTSQANIVGTPLAGSGTAAVPTGINSSSAIVGSNGTFWSNPTANAFSLTEAPNPLPASPIFIDDKGEIVSATYGNSEYWTSSTATPVLLPNPSNFAGVSVSDMSSDGEIVAAALVAAGGTTTSLYWSSITATPIQIPNPSGFTASYVQGVANGGKICGAGINGKQMALYWATPSSAAMTLASIYNGVASDTATAVNSSGIVVGTENLGLSEVAVRWTVVGTSSVAAQDLNNLVPANSGWNLFTADAINDQGWIIGEGVYQGNHWIYLLKPAP